MTSKSSKESGEYNLTIAEIRHKCSLLAEQGEWEKCIGLWRSALGLTRDADRCGDWFIVRLNLAIELGQSPKDFSEDTIEEAIGLLHGIEAAISSKECPREYAITQLALGQAFSKRIQGSRHENMGEVLRYYKGALAYFEEEGDAIVVAEIIANIGNTHAEKVMGWRGVSAVEAFKLRKQHYREAVKCYKIALATFTESEFEEEYRELTEKIQILEGLIERVDQGLANLVR
jgi:tetratricopeptide (TPR) repeat protein